MSQRELARRIGVSQSRVSQYFRSRIVMPLQVAEKIAEALGEDLAQVATAGGAYMPSNEMLKPSLDSLEAYNRGFADAIEQMKMQMDQMTLPG